MRDFRKIVAWQKADDFTVAVYRATKGFPKEEVYGLTSQLRRASSSVAANIAEGAARRTEKDYLHFLYIALGSLSEARSFLHLARRLGYWDEQTYAESESSASEVFGLLHGLIRAIEGNASATL